MGNGILKDIKNNQELMDLKKNVRLIGDIMELGEFTIEELFLSAIRAEMDSFSVYSKLADTVKNAFLKDKLKFLAGEEQKHKAYLEEVMNKRLPEKDLEIPEKSIVPLPSIQLPSESVPLSEVLASAMAAEMAARDFYTVFARQIHDDDDDLIKTLELFATMELGHYKLLEIEKENVEKFEEYDDYWPMMHIGT